MRKLGKDNIIPRDPNFSTDHTRVRENHFWPYFKGAIGATINGSHVKVVATIEGSHVKVVVPVDEVVNHRCRYGYTYVLVICDFDMRFNFVVVGWPGAAHDTRILNHTLANFSSFLVHPKCMHGKSFPLKVCMVHYFLHFMLVLLVLFILPHLLRFIEKYYLVDSDYPNRIVYLAPYKGSTYHIPEFRHRTCPPQGKYEVFNFLHSSLRNVIEKSFGVLKQKWRILKSM
jgi:hypothetical protein